MCGKELVHIVLCSFNIFWAQVSNNLSVIILLKILIYYAVY